MRSQSTRTDVMPLTWEVPVTLAAAAAVLVMLAVPTGQGLAALLTSGHFVWPDGRLVASVVGLALGRPARGLPRTEQALVPEATPVYACIALLELLTLAATWCAFAFWWRHGGPGTQWGMADRLEVASTLGVGNLRRRADHIRPDLHPRGRR